MQLIVKCEPVLKKAKNFPSAKKEVGKFFRNFFDIIFLRSKETESFTMVYCNV